MSEKIKKRFVRSVIEDFCHALEKLKADNDIDLGKSSSSDTDDNEDEDPNTVTVDVVKNVCQALKTEVFHIEQDVNRYYKKYRTKRKTVKRQSLADTTDKNSCSNSSPNLGIKTPKRVSFAPNEKIGDAVDQGSDVSDEIKANDADSTTGTTEENTSVHEKPKFALKVVDISKLLKPGCAPFPEPKNSSIIELDSDSDDELLILRPARTIVKKTAVIKDSDDDSEIVENGLSSRPKTIKAQTKKNVPSSAAVKSTIARDKLKSKHSDQSSKKSKTERNLKNFFIGLEKFPKNLNDLLSEYKVEEIIDTDGVKITENNYTKLFIERSKDTLQTLKKKYTAIEEEQIKKRVAKDQKKSSKKNKKIKNRKVNNSENKLEKRQKSKMSENNNRYDSDDDDESSKQTYSTEKEEDNDLRCLKTSSSDSSSGSSSSSSSSSSDSSSSSGSSSSSSDDSDDENEGNAEQQPLTTKKRKHSNDQEIVPDTEEVENTENSDNEEDEEEEENGVSIKVRSEVEEDDEEVFQPKKKKPKTEANKEDQDADDKKGRKRRRIKKVSSSEEDENDDKNSPNKGRKNIRKLLTRDSLDATTKQAAREERERKLRIEERQKLYNQIYDGKPEEIKELNKLVLDFDEETKEVLLEVDRKLVKKLKPHQATGIKFMFDACFESMERMHNSEGSGCILAHCMGLGKTLQVITLCHTLLSNSDRTNVNRILVVCPLSTVLNWVNEFKIWLKFVEKNDDLEIYEISKFKQNVDRANKIMEWHNDGGVMILGYEMFRNLTNDTGTKLKKKIKQSLQTSLVEPGPDLIICDEGHLLKNEKTSLSKSMNRIRTQRRIVLTGTPLQNNLKEYYCMVTFVKPNLLGKYNEYMNRFVNPITNGQYTDSTERDIQIMKRRSHVLHKMLDGCVQRKDYAVLAPFLPPKHEYVVSVRLTKMQIELYEYYMKNKSMLMEQGNQKRSSILFTDFQNLQRIWTHPRVLRYNSDKYEQVQAKKREMESEEESENEGSLKDFIDDDLAELTSSDSDSDSAQSINSDESYTPKKKKNARTPRRTRATYNVEDDPVEVKKKEDNPTEWWMQICPESELDNMEHSGKLKILFSILEECEAIGDKLLVFSQSLYSLDVIEHFLSLADGPNQSWSMGLDYFRLDGQTSVENRSLSCKLFNKADNPRARLFLISTRAGGLGINLTAANRVIIFDVSWNPSHDIQSIFRVYRFGQDKPCYVYRFLAMGTMEEKIYERQVTKQAISKRVIDEQQIDRHYKENDLQELYRYELIPTEARSIPSLPKDRMFAELFKKYEEIIFKFHEHDSLLENKEEETLNEEERKAAWDEFEAEKNRPVQTYNFVRGPGTGPVTSSNIYGLRSDILLRLLSLKARHDNPAFDEMQIKTMIPLLMQELHAQMATGEITLYQSLLSYLAELEVPQYGYNPMVNNMIGSYNNMISAAANAAASSSQGSNNMVTMPSMTPTQMNIMRLINQQKLMAQAQQQAALMNSMPHQSGLTEQHNHMIEQAQNRLMNIKKTNIPPSATIEID